MTDIREKTEALLKAMGWRTMEIPRGDYWISPDATMCAYSKEPSVGWLFATAVPWATGKGWTVGIDRERQGEAEVCVVAISGAGPFTYRWKPGEPDRTADAIVTALYDALMGERE